MVQIFGWFKEDAARASRRNRSMAWGSWEMSSKKFQRDIPAQARVLGLIDHAHTAAAEFFEDGVMGDGATDNGRSIRHSPRSLLQLFHAGNRAKSCPARHAKKPTYWM